MVVTDFSFFTHPVQSVDTHAKDFGCFFPRVHLDRPVRENTVERLESKTELNSSCVYMDAAGDPKEMTYSVDVHGRDYCDLDDLEKGQASAAALYGSSQLFRLSILGDSGTAGWQNINMGDTYEQVLSKLGIAADHIEESTFVDAVVMESGQNMLILDHEGSLRLTSRFTTLDNEPMLRVTFIDRTGEAEYTILFELSGGQLSYTAYENLALQIEAAASVQPEDSSTPEPTTAVVPSGQEVTPPETYEVQTEIESVPTQNEDPTETEVSTAVKEPYSERYDFANGNYYIYEYSADGIKLSEAFFYSDDSIGHFTEYYENEKEKRYTGYYSDGTVKLIREYYENGKEKRGTYYKSDGTVNLIHEYDESGQCIRTTWYNTDGSVRRVLDY